jgi:hypothetical protein
MDINKLNEQLNQISNDFNTTNQYTRHKNKLDEELKKEMINKETINNRMANFAQDTTMYVNPNNNSYYTDFRIPQNSSKYKTGNRQLNNVNYNTITNNNANTNINTYNKSNITRNQNNNLSNDMFKRENRDDMNEKLNGFNFNNFNYVNGSTNLDNPLIKDNYYNTGPGIKSNNHGFDKMNDFNIVHTKIERTNNRNLQNERLQSYSPLGRALGAGFTFDINNNLSSINSKSGGNYKSNYKDLNNERLNNFSPLSKTLTINTKQEHVASSNNVYNNNNSVNNNNRQNNLINKQVNFNDINPKLNNSVMTYHPINSRIE